MTKDADISIERTWDEYSRLFSKEARRQGFDANYVDRCLSYAKNLHFRNLPIIYSQDHLAGLVGYQIEYLSRFSNDQRDFYRSYKIKKKSGGLRQIDEPLPSLKEIQRWILDNLLNRYSTHSCAKAFKEKLSIKDNARFHKRQSFVISMDVKDFFGSLSARRVYKLFLKSGYSESVALLLTKACTLRGVLPQGAPTSPTLSNILTQNIDKRIFAFCQARHLRYTRYADDITISGSSEIRPGRVVKFVREVLRSNGLQLNDKKTRVLKRHQKQEVTGIVVNEVLQVSRERRRKIRAERYYIEKYGLESHMLHNGIMKAHYKEHLLGMANFVLFVDKNNLDARALVRSLSGKQG